MLPVKPDLNAGQVTPTPWQAAGVHRHGSTSGASLGSTPKAALPVGPSTTGQQQPQPQQQQLPGQLQQLPAQLQQLQLLQQQQQQVATAGLMEWFDQEVKERLVAIEERLGQVQATLCDLPVLAAGAPELPNIVPDMQQTQVGPRPLKSSMPPEPPPGMGDTTTSWAVPIRQPVRELGAAQVVPLKQPVCELGVEPVTRSNSAEMLRCFSDSSSDDCAPPAIGTTSVEQLANRSSARQDLRVSAGVGDDEAACPAHPTPVLRKGRITKTSVEAFENLPTHMKTERHYRDFVWAVLDDPESSKCAAVYSQLQRIFLTATVLVTFLQTTDSPPFSTLVGAMLETGFDVIFVIEMLVRMYVCPAKWHMVWNFYNWVDVVSASALLVRVCEGFVLREEEHDSVPHIYLLFVIPIIRLLKMLRHFEQFHLLLGAFKLSFEALPVLLYMLLMITLVGATCIYIVEPRDNISSWPVAIWLSIVTMTTVGYGDVTPVSSAGSTFVAVLVVISVLFMAMPLGIIGSTFNQVWQDRDRIILMQRTRERLTQWGYSARDFPVLFKLVDENGDGVMDVDEFRLLIRHMKIGLADERVVQLFDLFDDQGKGLIDLKDFARALFPGTQVEVFEPISTSPSKADLDGDHSRSSSKDRVSIGEGGV